MSQRNRYFVWRGIESVDDQVDKLIAISKSHEEEATRVTDQFAVVFLTENEIRSEFPGVTEGQILIPDDAEPRIEYQTPGEFLLGNDVPVDLAEYAGSRNVMPGGTIFDRIRAEGLIDAQAIRDYAAEGERVVNVVVVDGGMDEGYLRSIGYTKDVKPVSGLDGAKTQPHVQESQRHANAIARSILSIAPDVQLYDAPILPDRIDHIDLYSSRVIELVSLLDPIITDHADEAWIVVCAWGLLDRKFDRFLGTYADDHRHNLSSVIKYLETRNVDVVFSAGNSGQFWPDLRSGHTDRGPHRSIIGSNGLRSVLTVGAVDAIGHWIGESSQGTEPVGMRTGDPDNPRKPDVCAPSWFSETYDKKAVLTGTSGACAVAAGVVAAVRRRVDSSTRSPAELIDELRRTARHEGVNGINDRSTPAHWRLGSGIIDCTALVASLP